jgi:peroxiredoxin
LDLRNKIVGPEKQTAGPKKHLTIDLLVSLTLQGENNPMRRSTAPLTFACIALALALASQPGLSQQGVHSTILSASERKPASPFSLVDASGKTVQLSDYKGKVVLLNLWATDCGGCLIEIPSLINLQQAYKDKGFTVVGISVDIAYSHLNGPDEAWSKVKPFVAAHNMSYPILMGDDAALSSFATKTVPASFLLDKSGKVATTYIGVVDKNDVESNIKALLAEP